MDPPSSYVPRYDHKEEDKQRSHSSSTASARHSSPLPPPLPPSLKPNHVMQTPSAPFATSPSEHRSSENPHSSTPHLHINQENETTIQPLLMAVDSMREILSDTNIQIPSIVVVGDQSSGKSSVLEAISSIGLPRGNGIVTRCPLVLRLVRQSDAKSPYATLSNSASSNLSNLASLDGKTYTSLPIKINDINKIGECILKLTNIIVGSDHGISATPLYLTVCGKAYPDLTLIDLPGITRNALQGQDENIYEQITLMIQRYIQNPETIILNIVPANSDLSVSEGIRLARHVDPAGLRTLVVATKPDTVDNGRIVSDLEQMVDKMRLKLGIVVVRNRTTDEIDQNMSFQVAREREVEFFNTHPSWKSKYAKEKTRRWTTEHTLNGIDASQKVYLGVPALIKILVTLQSQAVRRAFPSIKQSVSQNLIQHKDELAKLPRCLESASEYRMHFDKILSESMNGVQKYFSNADYSLPGDKEEFHIYPRLKRLYEDCDSTIKSHLTDSFTEMYALQIQKIMSENEGRNITSAESINVFRTLIKEEVKLFITPLRHALDKVQVLVEHVLYFIISQQSSAFLHIEAKLKELVKGFVQKNVEEAWSFTLKMIETENNRSFTPNNYFVDTCTKLSNEIKRMLYDIVESQRCNEEKAQMSLSCLPAHGNESGSLTQHMIPSSPFSVSSPSLSSSSHWNSSISTSHRPKAPEGAIRSITRKIKGMFQPSSSSSSPSLSHSQSSTGLTDEAIEDSELGTYYNREPIRIQVNNLTLHVRSIEFYKINAACMGDENRFESVLKTQVNVYGYTQWFLMFMLDSFSRHIDSCLLQQVSGYRGLYERFQEFVNAVKDEDIQMFMSESPEVKEKREKLKAGIKKLEQATRIIEKALA